MLSKKGVTDRNVHVVTVYSFYVENHVVLHKKITLIELILVGIFQVCAFTSLENCPRRIDG